MPTEYYKVMIGLDAIRHGSAGDGRYSRDLSLVEHARGRISSSGNQGNKLSSQVLIANICTLSA